MKLVQNWLPFNETILFSYSDKYFREAGTKVFSNQGKSKKDIVPSSMTNSMAHARSLATFVKENLKQYPIDERIKILEIGSSTGLFAKNFLSCAKEMNFLNRIEYLVSEYSRVSLENIKQSNILGEYQENLEYRFVHLDILNPHLAEDLQGNPYQLENLSVTVLNYILCVLPATVVKQSPNGKLQQLLLRFKEENDCVRDLGYLDSLTYEEDWKAYILENESELEKKYANVLHESLKNKSSNPYEYYAYGSLSALENILNRSNKNGFVFISEMPRFKNSTKPFKPYGDSIALPLNQSLICSFAKSQESEIVYSTDPHYPLARLFILKNPNQKERFSEIFKQEYLDTNNSNLILELRAMLSQFHSKHSCSIMKKLLDKLVEIDADSYETNLLLSQYFYLTGDSDQAKSKFMRAKNLDYLKNLDEENDLFKKIMELKNEPARF
jgi:hypothetical protein